ncbi:MAG: CHAD domain-containing protein [Bacteroidia bacterium]
MKSKIIASFISNHLKSVERQLYGFDKDRKIERLHSLRVDIKKVRAILSFIEKIYREKFDSSSLKLLFKNAGEIREFQITIELLSLLSLPPQSVIFQFKKEQDSLQQQFINDISQYLHLVRKFRKRTFLDFLMPDKKIVRKYLNSRRKKAARNFNSHSRAKMHRFRKLIKKVMYVYAILPEKMKKLVELDTALIDKVQKDVGCWHDTYAAIGFLSRNIFEEMDEYISLLKQKEAREFESLFINYPCLKI